MQEVIVSNRIAFKELLRTKEFWLVYREAKRKAKKVVSKVKVSNYMRNSTASAWD